MVCRAARPRARAAVSSSMFSRWMATPAVLKTCHGARPRTCFCRWKLGLPAMATRE